MFCSDTTVLSNYSKLHGCKYKNIFLIENAKLRKWSQIINEFEEKYVNILSASVVKYLKFNINFLLSFM